MFSQKGSIVLKALIQAHPLFFRLSEGSACVLHIYVLHSGYIIVFL